VNSSSKLLLVTGASGFLGSRIVRHAREGGWGVRALCRSPQSFGDGIELVIGDIRDTSLLRSTCQGVAAIVHAAGLAHVFGRKAKDAATFKAINELGTLNIVNAAVESNVRHVILLSSVAVYGNSPRSKWDETVACHPKGPYGVSKWRGELKAADRARNTSTDLTILRLATVYGEGDRGNVARLIRLLDRGRFIWLGSGLNRKSLIYVEDAARACVRALERSVPGVEVFNVSGTPVPMRQIVMTICEALGCQVPKRAIPAPILDTALLMSRAFGDSLSLFQRITRFVEDDAYEGTKFERTFGFKTLTSLSTGLHREVDYIRTRVLSS
jgi:nucleoside-diphosphate-sugar epimerase